MIFTERARIAFELAPDKLQEKILTLIDALDKPHQNKLSRYKLEGPDNIWVTRVDQRIRLLSRRNSDNELVILDIIDRAEFDA